MSSDNFDAMQNASVNDDSFDVMRKACGKKKDSLFENIEKSENLEFVEYDKEADQRYESAKAFRIPKKTLCATPTNSNQSMATMSVRNILREIEGHLELGHRGGTGLKHPVVARNAENVEGGMVAKVTSVAQEVLPTEEEELSMEVEVTEVEIVVME